MEVYQLRRIIPLWIIVVVVALSGVAQDMHFSQFNQAPLYANPAFTGAFVGDQRVILNYKDQWRSIGVPYRTAAISLDAGLFKRKWKTAYLGAGLAVFNDRAGDTKFGLTQVNLSASGIVYINDKNHLSLGLQGGYAQRSVDKDAMRWDEQFNGDYYDQSLASGESTVFEPYGFGDLSAGFLWNFSAPASNVVKNNPLKWNVGVAFFHLNKPKQKFYSTNRDVLYAKMVVHGGGYVGLAHTKLALLPSIFYQRQGKSDELDIGMMVRFQLKEESKLTGLIKETAIRIGGYYRLQDAVIPAFIIEFANFALGVSYDFNVSTLSAASNAQGGIEISLKYVNPNPFSIAKNQVSVKFL